jgi:hypothetical protein
MDTTFLSYLLALCLALILVLYLYQSKTIGKNNNIMTNNKNKKDVFLPVIYDTCKTKRISGMPVHRVGPIINFHQSFGKYKNIQNNTYKNGFPNGIPEMAWRNFYLSNFNHNEVNDQDPFNGTVIRNYLDNMDNVKNIYREC